jgi:hypothetical protein
MEHVASRDIEDLGLVFSTSPPDPLVIKGVSQSSWAQKQGISEGDMILAVNGVAVDKLTDSEFRLALKNRPLAFMIDSLRVGPQETRLPVALQTLQCDLAKSACHRTVPDADLWWLECESGEEQDDSTRASTVASLHSEPMEWAIGDEILEEGEKSDPSDDDTKHYEDESGLSKENAIAYYANENVTRLGLSFSTLPPDPLVIKRVSADSWAEARGIEAGDMIVAVNGIDVQKLTADDFVTLMRKRPLEIHVDSLVAKNSLSYFFKRQTLFDTDFLPFLAIDILKSAQECQTLW